jgi:hypothetical protein
MYNWRKGPFGVQLTDTHWFIRRVKNYGGWWPYYHNGRYSPTGKFSDVVSFVSLTDAKKFVTSKVVNDNLI